MRKKYEYQKYEYGCPECAERFDTNNPYVSKVPEEILVKSQKLRNLFDIC